MGPYTKGHPGLKKEKNPNWRGGKTTDLYGYVKLLKPEHPRADPKGYVRDHILKAEEALGKSLPSKAVVHHYLDHLVICQNQGYHLFLHARIRSYIATGGPNCRYCAKCGHWKLLLAFSFRPNGTRVYPCKQCQREYDAMRRWRKKNDERKDSYSLQT